MGRAPLCPPPVAEELVLSLQGRLEVPGAWGEEEEEGIPLIAKDGLWRCRLLCKPSALAQHLVRSLGRSAPALARELLQLPDTGLVALDWLVGPWGTMGAGVGDASPVLLLIPNAAGKVTGALLQLGLRALERGFVPVIFNRRGHNGCPLTTPRFQPFGDPRVAVGRVGSRVSPPFPDTHCKCRCHGNRAERWLPPVAMVPGLAQVALQGPPQQGAGTPTPAAGGSRPPPQRSFRVSASPRQPPRPRRYAGSLSEAVDVDRLLGSRSLRELEETLFCRTKSRPTSWDTYWERNEPLRDADEAAVPVLCLCSTDDPVRGPPARSLPTELFRSSPYFFLLLTRRGGHCGFPRQGQGRCWGHEVVLEYFKAMAEFLRAEERRKGPPRPRGSGGPAVEPPVFTWQRSYTRDGHLDPNDGHPDPDDGHLDPDNGHPDPNDGHPEPNDGHPGVRASPSAGPVSGQILPPARQKSFAFVSQPKLELCGYSKQGEEPRGARREGKLKKGRGWFACQKPNPYAHKRFTFSDPGILTSSRPLRAPGQADPESAAPTLRSRLPGTLSRDIQDSPLPQDTEHRSVLQPWERRSGRGQRHPDPRTQNVTLGIRSRALPEPCGSSSAVLQVVNNPALIAELC
ncbi:abhydrolase domain containing 15 [Columba livia]|uniref:Abhydrolase domain containing 15 n=1 Tax=Columba livia TaxID=8932 RepID=A0A2I0LNE4_COLLI|nr:abhydrolase domain containing 15 [Columba livia]